MSENDLPGRWLYICRTRIQPRLFAGIEECARLSVCRVAAQPTVQQILDLVAETRDTTPPHGQGIRSVR
jgi:hypothetical protein